VNEESENSASGPGRSAVTSTVILIGIYLLVSVASQAYAGTSYLTNNANDIFAGGLARGVLGSFHFLLIIAVLTSATAATQTTIIPAARQALSMARRGAIPSRFAEVHDRNMSPSQATIWAGVLSLIWFVAIEFLSTNVLADCVAGLGILVCIYYGFTGFCCTWFYRHELTKSVRNFFMLGLLPTVGGLILMVILVKAVTYYGNASNDSSGAFLGMGVQRDPVHAVPQGHRARVLPQREACGVRRSDRGRDPRDGVRPDRHDAVRASRRVDVHHSVVLARPARAASVAARAGRCP